MVARCAFSTATLVLIGQAMIGCAFELQPIVLTISCNRLSFMLLQIRDGVRHLI